MRDTRRFVTRRVMVVLGLVAGFAVSIANLNQEASPALSSTEPASAFGLTPRSGECLQGSQLNPVADASARGGRRASPLEAVRAQVPHYADRRMSENQAGGHAEVKIFEGDDVKALVSLMDLSGEGNDWIITSAVASVPCDETENELFPARNDNPPPGQEPSAPRAPGDVGPDPTPGGEMEEDIASDAGQ